MRAPLEAVMINYNNTTFFILLALVFMSPTLLFLFARRKTQLPPGPFAWPIIGNIFNLDAKRPHVTLANLAEAYGPLFSLRFGAIQVVVASSPATAREIFKTHDRVFSGRFVTQLVTKVPDTFSSVIAFATECNQTWRVLRSTAHGELFSAQALESYSQLRLNKAKTMLEYLGSEDGEVVKIGDVLFATSANILTNIMVSQDMIEHLGNIGEVKRSTRRLVEISVPSLADLYPAIANCGLDFWSKHKAAVCVEINRAFWGDIVSKRRERQHDVAVSKSSRDFLDVLIEKSFEDHQIYNILTELFVTSESFSTTLEWAMTELIRNKEAFAKLRDEVTEARKGTKSLTDSDLARLPYLQACIKETLRLHPPNPLLVPRCALQTCEVMNFKIPKGCLVVVNAYAIGRDPKTWEDPLNFRPERFLGSNVDVKGTHYELLPFGGGRRICAGYPLALREIQLLLASLVYAFDWLLPPGVDPSNIDMSEKFAITMAKEKPLLLIPKLRKDATIKGVINLVMDA